MCEPWCLTPAAVADLTDFQIYAMLAGQTRRVDRVRREADPGAGGATAGPPRVDRAFAVAYLMEHHGYDRAAAEAAVDAAGGL